MCVPEPHKRLAVIALLIASACTGQVTGTVHDEDHGPGPGGAEGHDMGGRGGNAPLPVMGGSSAAGSGSLPQEALVVSGPRFVRLTHLQWQNSVRDLLRLPAFPSLGLNLQADAVLGFDNDNAGTALDVSANLRSDYERAAESLATFAVSDAALLNKILPANLPAEAQAKGRAVIAALAERAYRRPLTAVEADELWLLWKDAPSYVQNADAFKAGVEVLLSALLQSPFFIYRPELGTAESTGAFSLTPFEVASKLSYSLVDTLPDEELLSAAKSGKLETTDQIVQQAGRLMKSPAAALSLNHFHEQLYRLGSFDKVQKDAKLFPEFGSGMSGFLKEEARLFLADLVQAEKPASAILTATETFANEATAALYGIAGVKGPGFSRVQLDGKQRSGLLTQLGFLAANAGSREPDPIHRGVFISQNLLCKTLPPPAANVPPVPTSGGTTNRQRVEAHTGKGTCGATCHGGLINPLGYAFESFDAIGRFRSTDNGAPVDASGEYAELEAGPVRFTDAVELNRQLAQSRDFHDCYLENWLQYLWARSKHDGDAGALTSLVDDSIKGQSVRSLLLRLVSSPSFRRHVP
jgi:hypothetical protein